VARLSLQFDAESPEEFYQRLGHCEAMRKKHESFERFTTFVESQSSSHFAPIP
jgi:hypothetical protein